MCVCVCERERERERERVRVRVRVRVCVCIRSSLHSVHLGQLLRYAYKYIVHRIRVYIERNNMQVELIRFHTKYRLYTRFNFAK